MPSVATDNPSRLEPSRFASRLADSIDSYLESHNPVVFGEQNEPLWESQVEAISSVPDFLRSGNNTAHIVKVGGAGKTRDAIFLSYLASKLGENSLFVVPSQQALRDFSDRAKKLCLDLEIGSVYAGEKSIGQLTFITYASLLLRILDESEEVRKEVAEYKAEIGEEVHTSYDEGIRIDPKKIAFVNWDECHWYLTPNAKRVLDRFSSSINIGYTATPRYYAGKEVSHVFGEKLYELDIDVAEARREIAPYTNIIVRSNITTNLRDLSPIQESSEEVCRAINVPERNLIFPDLYKNAELEVNGEKHTLTGEAAIIFGGTISHVHSLADAFNYSLMPLLKNDSEFRAKLVAKGLNPDDVESIAEPIHSGGNNEYPSMSIGERDNLLQRYEERKVLCLASTSLLQQSFDSKVTSVLFDAIPRQTYVGVGQAGMRALRYVDGKRTFIFNTEDLDRMTLSFNDCVLRRGSEEGTKIEIAKDERDPRNTQRSDKRSLSLSKLQYSTICGYEYEQLRKVRSVAETSADSRIYFGKYKSFTYSEYDTLNSLISDISNGIEPQTKTTEFLDLITPWFNRTSSKLTKTYVDAADLFASEADDIAVNILTSLIDKIKGGNIVVWSQFNTRFQTRLRQKLERFNQTYGKLIFDSLDSDITNEQADWEEKNLFTGALSDASELAKLPLSKSDLMPIVENIAPHNIANDELSKRFETVLKTLSYREREIIKLYYGFEDEYEFSLGEIARIFKITKPRARSILAKALVKLQQPSRSDRIKTFLDDMEEGGRFNLDERIFRRNYEMGMLLYEMYPRCKNIRYQLFQLVHVHGNGLDPEVLSRLNISYKEMYNFLYPSESGAELIELNEDMSEVVGKISDGVKMLRLKQEDEDSLSKALSDLVNLSVEFRSRCNKNPWIDYRFWSDS